MKAGIPHQQRNTKHTQRHTKKGKSPPEKPREKNVRDGPTRKRAHTEIFERDLTDDEVQCQALKRAPSRSQRNAQALKQASSANPADKRERALRTTTQRTHTRARIRRASPVGMRAPIGIGAWRLHESTLLMVKHSGTVSLSLGFAALRLQWRPPRRRARVAATHRACSHRTTRCAAERCSSSYRCHPSPPAQQHNTSAR